MGKFNYCRVADVTNEEKEKIYMKMPKKKLVEMLMESNRLLSYYSIPFFNVNWTCPSCGGIYPFLQKECTNPQCPSKFTTRTGTTISPLDKNNILFGSG